jgi:hypothetical protein
MSRTLSEVKNVLKRYGSTALADVAATLAEVAESLARTTSVLTCILSEPHTTRPSWEWPVADLRSTSSD